VNANGGGESGARVRKQRPSRTEPIRDYATLFTPGTTGATSVDRPDDFTAAIGGGVRAAYSVIDDYIREGQRVAAELAGRVGPAGGGDGISFLRDVVEAATGLGISSERGGANQGGKRLPVVEIERGAGTLALGYARLPGVGRDRRVEITPLRTAKGESLVTVSAEASLVADEVLVLAASPPVELDPAPYYGFVLDEADGQPLAVVVLRGGTRDREMERRA